MSDFDELLPAFIEESQQHLQQIEPDLLALESEGSAPDTETVNRIFRGIHSIKGASGFFGFANIGRLSHLMENSLALLRDGKITLSPDLVDALLSGLDALKSMLEDIVGSETFDIETQAAFLQRLIDDHARDRTTVTVSEKAAPAGEKAESALKKFDISEADIRRFVERDLFLYAVTIFLNADIRKKNKTPFDFIKNMEAGGQYVDSFLDIRSVTGLSDCLENELGFDFIFATELEPDAVSQTLDLPPAQITPIDLSEHQKEKAAEAPQETPAEPSEAELSEEEQAEAIPEAAFRQPSAEKEPSTASPEPTGAERFREMIHTEEKIRVGVNFLNELVNLAGELVLGRNQLMQTALPLTKTAPNLSSVLQHINRVTSEMQEKIMQMRMQPLSLIFDKFQRVVRDLARKHEKEVRLSASGGDVELDKTIIEGLSDPLNHLIRNAVDHAIEPPKEREKAGKPRFGTIRMRAFHQGGQVHLSISDDGRGIDGDRVGEKAVEKGVITADQLKEMSPRERVRLIFRPGFSTAEQVTDLSGRGVGMDVVITNIEHLGGTVDIETHPGNGTTVTLILPLTLAIISGLLITARDHYFILPEVDIDELVRVKPEEIDRRIDIIQDAWVLRLRETLLPLVDLNRMLNLGDDRKMEDRKPGKESQIEPGKESAQKPSPIPAKARLKERNRPLRILVIKHSGAKYGLLVDRIVNTEEIVVKPLPRYLKKMQSFSGVSILGNGRVSLILDVSGIVKKAAVRSLESVIDQTETEEERVREKETQTLLLFDNNTPERFALPLELIRRIEKIPASQIETIKEKQFLQYQDKKLRLIFLEDYLPVARPERTPDDILGIIVPKQMKYPMGIVFHQVINTVAASVSLDTETIMGQGLFGSAVLDGRITLLPDIYTLFELAAPEWYSTKRAEGSGPQRKYRVLLAEDTSFFRMVEKEYLESAGYEVLIAENGAVALRILEEETVDAAILDIVMPKLDGWGTIAAIRGDDRLKNLPVMAVTSLGDEGKSSNPMRERGFEAGFDEWEMKLNKTSLLEKLAALIKGKRKKGVLS